MQNEILWLAMLLANFLLIIFAYKLFGKWGLIMWIPISVIVANIQVIQTVELFGLAATLGNIVYASSFLVTDILSENYGKKEAQKAVWIGFFSLISMTLLMNLALAFQPLAGDDFASTAHDATSTIFGLMPRIAIASLAAYLLSQRHDVWAYHFWRKRFSKENQIWLRNNLSTMVSQLIDSSVFVLIAFYGVFETPVLVEIFITTYILKFVVAASDTPFIYWGKRIFKTNKFWVK
ncbi:MAG: queuosine precursor transporter [Prolixibacteraceae bacterium]|jgi:queuosine precursor transporter|nr:queuosine precursor transporter [Prolixibacteraceae bacterium]MBT6765349.1 queuosine precursor transporter [Prolixibacteraceae bacterium]MBT6997543.1 queuosine precursor transporter [Prolixibacteraceae bacterium]MBT7394563.1 queuosine precursor transporter [Prolixibacteraceae bacterium]